VTAVDEDPRDAGELVDAIADAQRARQEAVVRPVVGDEPREHEALTVVVEHPTGHGGLRGRR
jgi:hypothetical protein